MKQRGTDLQVRDMVYMAVCAALMAICAWITVPMAVPFTMQTFAMGLCAGLLSPRRSGLTVLVYILLGAVGLPVFSGFNAGAGALAGPTGGYIIGFLPMTVVASVLLRRAGTGFLPRMLALAAGLLVCYAFGTVWFLWAYTRSSGAIGLVTVLAKCVFPFVLPDLVKLALAEAVARRLVPLLHRGGRGHG